MANSYTQLHVHIIFAVLYRDADIKESWEPDLHKYITGIIQNNGHKVLQIGGMSDHIHILVGMRPNQTVVDLVNKVKSNSSLWINKNNLSLGKFYWQEGYSAFSYGKSQIDKVIKYIMNQKNHHSKKSFSEENKEFLDLFQIEYDARYILKDPE
jgi:REP element-mobilizing transposase RayT